MTDPWAINNVESVHQMSRLRKKGEEKGMEWYNANKDQNHIVDLDETRHVNVGER
jgi:hypothetical protein